MEKTSLAIMWLIVPLLFSVVLSARLIDLAKKEYAFWQVLMVPTLLLLSGAFFFLFLEQKTDQWILAGTVAFLNLLFMEQLFLFFHLPSRYRVYTLERLTLALHLVTMFLLGSSLYGLLILVHMPLWFLAPIMFLFSTWVIRSTLFASKVDPHRASVSALAGGLLLTELFVALSFLPVGHTTNATVLATFLYGFLGVLRAESLGRLTRSVVLRYAVSVTAVLLFIFMTSAWV